jgi:SpoIID/LytB domain protein
MRLRVLLLTAAIVLLGALSASAADDEWEIRGGGWGHGVGMSQFGAQGQALDERSYQQILQYYYTGTSVDSMPSEHWTGQENGLWVGLVSNTSSVTLQAVGGQLEICQPVGTCPPEPPYAGDFNDVTIEPGETWRFEAKPDDSSQCRFRKQGDSGQHLRYRECDALLAKEDSTHIRFRVNGVEYARGAIRFVPASNGFHVVVTLSMEEYLYGLREVPNSWHVEALKAQAVAGRGYALATAQARGGNDGSQKWSACGCHLRNTSADQVYAGWSQEAPGANLGDRWVNAVKATDRKVLTHPQSTSFMNIARTYYSSSNGGHSENVELVWDGPALPWLRSVEDPWSANPDINPLARWTMRLPTAKIKSEFGWDTVSNVEVTSGPPGAIVTFTGRKGGSTVTTTRHGEELRKFLNRTLYNPNGGTVRISPYVISVSYLGFFIDAAGHLFFNDINWAAEVGVTKGCNPPTNDRFCPDDRVTRGQMAAFINRYLKLPAPSKDHFVDDNGNTFENDINRLAEAGITKGCNPPANDRFCPDDFVTREQMAAFMVRALGLKANTHPGFDDVSSSNTFYNDIGRLATVGITRGCNPPANDRYCPKDFVTRGQMAAFIHRADNG